jgi:hypothetical protein
MSLRLHRATTSRIGKAMKIRLKIVDKEITATLIDSETTRDSIDSGLEALSVPGSVKVIIERVEN